MADAPPPPAGFTLDAPPPPTSVSKGADAVPPPPPPGFTLDAAPQQAPPPPPGFTLDAAPPKPAWGSPAARAEAQKGIERISADEPYAQAEGRHGRGSAPKGQAQAQDEKAAQAPPAGPTEDVSGGAIGDVGRRALAESPWMGRPIRTTETAYRTLQRSDAKKALQIADPNMSPEERDRLEHEAASDIGGVQDVVAGWGQMASQMVGSLPQLSRTVATAMDLPAQVEQWGIGVGAKLNGSKPLKAGPSPIMTPMVANVLHEFANDIDPSFHKVAKAGGDLAESYMTPQYKESIAKSFWDGIKDPLYWEGQAATAIAFMGADGLVAGGITRGTYAATYARTASELIAKKAPTSFVDAAAREAAEEAAVKSGMAASAVFNGAIIGGQTGQQIHDTITGLDDATKMKFPSYRQDRDAGLSEAISTTNLADNRSARATVVAGMFAMGPGLVLGKFISHTAVGMATKESLAGTIAKGVGEAGLAGTGQIAGTGLAQRVGMETDWKDMAQDERKNFLSEAVGGFINFAPLGLFGAVGYKRAEIDKITDNATGPHPRAGIPAARDNFLAASKIGRAHV